VLYLGKFVGGVLQLSACYGKPMTELISFFGEFVNHLGMTFEFVNQVPAE
jgi:hypothetical protein